MRSRPLPQRGSCGGIGQSYCLTSLLLVSRFSRRQHAKILVWFYWRPVVAFRSHNGLIIKALIWGRVRLIRKQ